MRVPALSHLSPSERLECIRCGNTGRRADWPCCAGFRPGSRPFSSRPGSSGSGGYKGGRVKCKAAGALPCCSFVWLRGFRAPVERAPRVCIDLLIPLLVENDIRASRQNFSLCEFFHTNSELTSRHLRHGEGFGAGGSHYFSRRVCAQSDLPSGRMQQLRTLKPNADRGGAHENRCRSRSRQFEPDARSL